MKDLTRKLIGKKISGVVIKKHKGDRNSPSEQLFRLFDDNTYFEIYVASGALCVAGAVENGGRADVHRYLEDGTEVEQEI